MTAKITRDVLEAYLQCRTKGHLKLAGEAGDKSDYEVLMAETRERVRLAATARLRARHQEGEVLQGVAATPEVLRRGVPLILDAIVEDADFCVRFDGLQRAAGPSSLGEFHYVPVLFHEAEKASKEHRALLELLGLILGIVQGRDPACGILIHGRGCETRRPKLQPGGRQARRALEELKELRGGGTLPRLTLNGHCQVCEFRQRCRAEATAKDDLSLLRGMSQKEIEKHRKRGIATVTQFSHSYQPGRRGKRRAAKARKHDHALQALALREKKVYVLDAPAIPQGSVALYLDVEGLPDQGFDYLIGLVAVSGGTCTTYSFWADDRSQEQAIWAECVRVIEGFGDCILYHYGRYESRFLDRMRKSARNEEEAAAADRIRARSCNVLAAIHSHVYFPTWSNGLKDVGTFLGAAWSAPNASGVQSMAWRLAWESCRDEALKQRLVEYNREDCLALRRVTEFVLSLGEGGGATAGQAGSAVAFVQDIEQPVGFRFGKSEFFCPELAHINRCAYSDYQRDKVYLRTNPAMRKSLRRTKRIGQKRPRVNEEVECGRPEVCPECRGPRVCSSGHQNRKVISDLRFTPSGVKRWVVRYSSLRYRCSDCKNTFYGDAYPTAESRLGKNVAIWTVYQHVALRQSYEDVTVSLNDLFGVSCGTTILHKSKSRMVEQYRGTYGRLKDKLRGGQLVHADETKVLIRSHAGYVWAFTNLEEVVYAYTPTREGTILEEMLDGFGGVLVSDFYSAYDSPGCKQQKCLIHLMRDVNDDIFHNPFDEELKELAQKLVGLLKPIIDTIDRYGLKQYHLNKHKADVARFFRYLSEESFESEAATKNRKRLLKYQEKLFVFLDHDNVPWNNNNAENAIKRFASRRKIIGNWPTEKGLQDYLVFLSIYQTCRLKNLSFLRFLRSGLLDIDAFAEGGGR
jgi:predicted RecB family nuclease